MSTFKKALKNKNYLLVHSIIDNNKLEIINKNKRLRYSILEYCIRIDAPFDIIKKLLDIGISPNSKNGWYWNCMHIAAIHSSPLIIRLLVKYGCTINCSHDVPSPLFLAVDKDLSFSIISTLIRNGSDTSIRFSKPVKPMANRFNKQMRVLIVVISAHTIQRISNKTALKKIPNDLCRVLLDYVL